MAIVPAVAQPKGRGYKGERDVARAYRRRVYTRDVGCYPEALERVGPEFDAAALCPEVCPGAGLQGAVGQKADGKIYPRRGLSADGSGPCQKQEGRSKSSVAGLGPGSYCRVSCTSATCCSVVSFAPLAVPTTSRV